MRVKSDEPGAPVLDHGAVVIAAITSCTNTSNPEVMLGAARRWPATPSKRD